MLRWSRHELRTLALWHFAHGFDLDESDSWHIEITPSGVTCNRRTIDQAQVDEGRALILRAWSSASGPDWSLVMKRHGDTFHPRPADSARPRAER